MRKELTSETILEVLTRSRRRCALCFGLRGDLRQKDGQLAHVDRDASNNDTSNICFLCLEHHNLYDTQYSQSKGYTAQELNHYRETLYTRLEESDLRSDDRRIVQASERPLGVAIAPSDPLAKRPHLVMGWERFRGHRPERHLGIVWSQLEPLFIRNDGDVTGLNIEVTAGAFGGNSVTCSISRNQLTPSTGDTASLHLYCKGERIDIDLQKAFMKLLEARIAAGAKKRCEEQLSIHISYADLNLNQHETHYEIANAMHPTANGRWQAESVKIRLVGAPSNKSCSPISSEIGPVSDITHSPTAQNIRKYRQVRHWTQEELARASGLEVRTIERAEAGSNLSVASLRAIAAAFDISIEELSLSDLKIAALLEEFRKAYQVIDVKPIAHGFEIAPFLRGADASQFERVGEFDDDQMDAIAEFESDLQEWLEIGSDLTPIHRREAEKSIDQLLEVLTAKGVTVSIGDDALKLTSGEGPGFELRVLYVAFSKRDRSLSALLRKREGRVSLS